MVIGVLGKCSSSLSYHRESGRPGGHAVRLLDHVGRSSTITGSHRCLTAPYIMGLSALTHATVQ